MAKTTEAVDGDPMLAPRSINIPSFMRTAIVNDPAGVDIALIGVPYDLSLIHI